MRRELGAAGDPLCAGRVRLWERQLVSFQTHSLRKQAGGSPGAGRESRVRDGSMAPEAFERTQRGGSWGVLRSAGLGLSHLWGPPGLEPGAPHLSSLALLLPHAGASPDPRGRSSRAGRPGPVSAPREGAADPHAAAVAAASIVFTAYRLRGIPRPLWESRAQSR